MTVRRVDSIGVCFAMSVRAEIKTLEKRARESFYGGDHDLMAELLEEAWAIAVLRDDPRVSSSLAHTASDLFNRASDKERALEMALLALEHKRLEGTADVQLANILLFLGKLLNEMGRAPEGAGYVEGGVRLFAELFGEDHSETRLARQLLQDLTARAQPKGKKSPSGKDGEGR